MYTSTQISMTLFTPPRALRGARVQALWSAARHQLPRASPSTNKLYIYIYIYIYVYTNYIYIYIDICMSTNPSRTLHEPFTNVHEKLAAASLRRSRRAPLRSGHRCGQEFSLPTVVSLSLSLSIYIYIYIRIDVYIYIYIYIYTHRQSARVHLS